MGAEITLGDLRALGEEKKKGRGGINISHSFWQPLEGRGHLAPFFPALIRAATENKREESKACNKAFQPIFKKILKQIFLFY